MADVARIGRKIANECPGVRVRKASRVLSKLYDDELRPLGVQSSQLPVLAAVAIFGERGAKMSALARAIVMDRTTLTRNVRPLEEAGWLRVARSPDDARSRIVFLTPSGERLLEAVFPIWERVMATIRSGISARVLAGLESGLDEIIALAPDPGPTST
jgi:DNA-binding MarR family transcriptional regulator